MSRAFDDVAAASPTLRAVTAQGPTIELVSTTGARALAVLVFRSADLDEPASPDQSAPVRVYGLAVPLGPSPPRIGAAARAAAIEVWRTSTRFDADRGSAMAWIMAIAHRRAVDRLRSVRDAAEPAPVLLLQTLGRRARRHAHLDRDARQSQAAHTEVEQVREALSRLGPEQREVLELVYLEPSPADLGAILSALVTTPLPEERVGAEQRPRTGTSPRWVRP